MWNSANAWGYGKAGSAFVAAVLLQSLPALQPYPFVAFVGAVVVAALYAGFRAALAVTLASALAANLMLYGGAGIGSDTLAATGVFGAISVAVAWLVVERQRAHAYRRESETQLRRLNETLEERVAERTAELVRSQEALREGQERLSLALTAARMGSWDWDTGHNTIVYDDAMCGLFGFQPGHPPRNFDEAMSRVHADDRHIVEEAIWGTLADGQPYSIEYRVVLPDGQVRQITARGQMYRGADGRPARLTGVCWDTTDTRRLEEALRRAERLAAIGQMMTGLSHESRNALQRSFACLEMLGRRIKDNPDAERLMAEARQAQNDLRHVYDQVLDYARPIRLHRRPVNLAEVWRAAWDKLEAARDGLAASLIEEGAACVCEVDPFQVEQVFRNLFDNSLAACGEAAEIRVRCEAAEVDGVPGLRVSVRDNGPGLDPEQRRRMFEPFFTTKMKGTGLGMSIARRIVESHGGRMTLGGETGAGLEVVMEIPLQATGHLPLDDMSHRPIFRGGQ